MFGVQLAHLLFRFDLDSDGTQVRLLCFRLCVHQLLHELVTSCLDLFDSLGVPFRSGTPRSRSGACMHGARPRRGSPDRNGL